MMNHPVSPAENDPLLPEQYFQAQHGVLLRKRLLLLIFVCVVAVDFGSYLSYAPQLAIFEGLICRQFYGSGEDGSVLSDGNGSQCKSPEVQGELALILGWKDTLDQVPGVVLAVFYGVMSDRIGRKPILLLSLTGLILQEAAIRCICWSSPFVPLRAVWVSPLFQVIGGGSQIATSMAYAMLTNVYATKKRYVMNCVSAAHTDYVQPGLLSFLL